MTAVTSVGDDVFVLRWLSSQVEVYNAGLFTFQRYIAVRGLGYSWGLAACARYKCLYVSDCSHNSVHRIELSGSDATKQWSVASQPLGLSVNKERNVVVACCEANKIQEYTTHGTLAREICLQGCVTSPWQAVQLSSGDYVVSQYTSPGAVSVVAADGQVVHAYDDGKTNYPTSIAVDTHDVVHVADSANDRVLSMNSSLSCVQELTLSVDGGIDSPWGLCLDESRGRLYVGEESGRWRVLVFDATL